MKEKRYTITITTQIHVNNDKEALVECKNLVKFLNNQGSNTNILKLQETPFASADFKEIDISKIK